MDLQASSFKIVTLRARWSGLIIQTVKASSGSSARSDLVTRVHKQASKQAQSEERPRCNKHRPTSSLEPRALPPPNALRLARTWRQHSSTRRLQARRHRHQRDCSSSSRADPRHHWILFGRRVDRRRHTAARARQRLFERPQSSLEVFLRGGIGGIVATASAFERLTSHGDGHDLRLSNGSVLDRGRGQGRGWVERRRRDHRVLRARRGRRGSVVA